MHICDDTSLLHVVMKLCPSLIAGRKVRERERLHGAFTLIFCFPQAWFLRISKHNVWVNQSILLQLLPMNTHARIQKVLSEGVQLCNSDNVFFLFRGERIQIPLKAGHYRPASETTFKWRLAGVLNGVLLAGR